MSDESRKRSNANLQPGRWTKGQSGNPGGRKRGVEKWFRKVAEERVYIAKDGTKYTGLDALAHVLLDIAYDHDEQARDRRAAVDSFVDRGWGKVKEQHEITGGMTPEQAAFFEAIRMTPHERRLAAQDSTIPDDVAADDAAAAEFVDGDNA